MDNYKQNIKFDNGFYLKRKSHTLSNVRKEEISNNIIETLPILKLHRIEHLKKVNEQREFDSSFSDKSIPAWVRVSRTDSEFGYRLIIGFRNNTCTYRDVEPLGLGCFNCGFYAGNGEERSATIDELIDQLKKGLSIGIRSGVKFDVIEFLNDGSFLNDVELPKEARRTILQYISLMPNIKRILIESTPEFILKGYDKLRDIMSLLREDQELEIAVGLETSDDFIRFACINKGFLLKTFENSVKIIADLSKEFNGRCSVLSYVLVKPAFLTEIESINDTIATISYLAKISKDYQIKIIPKLEPAAIVDGTLLSLLYGYKMDNAIKYEPLNYWAILEILARTFYLTDSANIFEKIRIGARDDMYDIVKVPAIYRKDGRYDQFDFILYDAIQQFNKHHNLHKLFAVIELTYSNGVQNLINSSSSLVTWIKQNMEEEKSSIIKFINYEYSEILNNSHKFENITDSKFLRSVYNVLDRLEGYDDDKKFVKKIIDIVKKSNGYNEVLYQEIEQVITSCFINGEKLFEIRVQDVKKIEDEFVRINFEAIDFISGRTYSLWSRVPL